MKNKILQLSLIFLSILINISPIFATTDTTPPTINSITINKNSLYGGESVTFSINASDDISGVEKLAIEYKLKSDPSKHIAIDLQNNGDSNNFSYTYSAPTSLSSGLWESYVIQIWDSAWNLKTYWKTNSEDNSVIQFSNLDFTILENPDFDTTPPTLSSISVKNKVITAPGLIEITANASDNKTTNLNIGVTYLIRGEQYATTLSRTTGTTYNGSLYVNEDAKYATATFAYTVIKDDAGNEVWYSYNPSQYPFGDASRLLTTNIDVSFSNSVSDTQDPVLSSYSYSKNTVTVPGSFEIIVNATDNTSGIASVKIYFSGRDEEDKLVGSWILNAQYNSTKKAYVSKFTFDQYEPNSTYSVTIITLTDGAGNSVNYSINPQGDDKKIDQQFVTVVKGIESDIETGTMNDDYIQSIENAKDGSSISIDCTKNTVVKGDAFDSIRNTEKKIVLVSDGIQWIFNGKDIINPSKSIDTKINILTLDEYGNQHLLNNFEESTNGLVIEFASNGLLPGKALIKIKADYTFRNYIGEKALYVYYFNEASNGLEAIANRIEMSTDGYYEFYITHNSKYIITSKKAPSVVKDASEINADFNTELIAQEEIIQPKLVTPQTVENITEKDNPVNSNLLMTITAVFLILIIVSMLIFRKKLAIFKRALAPKLAKLLGKIRILRKK